MSDVDLSGLGRALVVDSPRYAIFATDLAGTVLSWNRGVQELFGYSAEEFVGLPAEVLFRCGERRSGELQSYLGVARRDGSSMGVARLVGAGGETLAAHVGVSRLDPATAGIEGFAFIIHEHSSEPSDRRDSIALRALDLTHAFVRSLDGRILLWTEGAQRLYGYARDEAEGRLAGDLLQTASSVPIDEIVAAVRTRGEWQGGLAHRRRDGSTVFLASHWTLHRDQRGEPAAIVEVNNDITQLLASESERESLTRELTDARSRLEAILHQLPLGVAIAAAPSGELVLHNDEAVRLLRHPMHPCASVEDYIAYGALHADGSPYSANEHPIAQALTGALVMNHEMLYRRGDGTQTHFLVNAGPVRDRAGNVVAAVTIFQDISERKRAEAERERLLAELRRSNEDLSQFAHTVSHDLQEPLRTMRSYSDLLVRRYGGALGDGGSDFIRYIAEGAGRMDELVQALLQYARAGGAQLSLEPVDGAEIVKSALANLEPLLEASGGVVEWSPLPVLQIDAVQMTQVFQNLIGNALKYRAPGAAPVVRINAEPRRGVWEIAVADNGIGIAAAHHHRVFAPLKRLHGATVPGSGMGLAICRKIVQRHGGDIWVESEPGKGSTFRFTLPR